MITTYDDKTSLYKVQDRDDLSTIILHPNVTIKYSPTGHLTRTAASRLDEINGLAQAIGLDVVVSQCIKVTRINAGRYFGRGTIDRVKEIIKINQVKLAIIDCQLSAIQQRNLELDWNCKVIDRTALILEIFGARARTHEGRLQVELAALSFQRSRLVRSWTHLERQRGGAGFLGGPGERQIELDRRQIDQTITQLEKELLKVKRTRGLHRKARKRVPFPIIAFVGYTNAGKSTLFNLLSRSNVVAKNMLFATLDPTMRKILLPSRRPIIISDTVGFISNLPTHLIAAFRSTLEEVLNADLIVHVRDISHPDTEFQKLDVLNVLEELGVNTKKQTNNIIEVLNKADLLSQEDLTFYTDRKSEFPLLVSAITGLGSNDLQKFIDKALSNSESLHDFKIEASNGAAISWVYRHSDVKNSELKDSLFHINASLTQENINRFYQKFSQTKGQG